MLQKLLSILSLGLLPKKRASAEVNDDEQTNEDSDGPFRKGNNAKRARLDSFSDTTLQDLPNELLECILVKAVAVEVKNLKLIKSVWKDKVDLVINRLKSVSSHWTSILSTDVFRNKVHKLLDGTAPEKMRLEMLRESPIKSFNLSCVTSLKDEIFTVEQRDDEECFVITVCNRDNVATVKDVIRLETYPECMAACNVSNCVYVGIRNADYSLSVLRISKDGDGQFNISPWIMNDRKLSIYIIYVADNGNLLIRPMKNGKVRNVVRICHANGALQRQVMLPQGIPASLTTNALQKSNGNLVMVHKGDDDHKTNLLELDANGSLVRRYESDILAGLVNFADIHGRVVITGVGSGSMELLDSEFNLIGIYGFQQDEEKLTIVSDVHFTSERNEIVRTQFDCISKTHVVNIFRFTEE